MNKIITKGKNIEQLRNVLQKLEKINITEKESLQFMKDIFFYKYIIDISLDNFYFKNYIALTKEIQEKLENEILFIFRKMLLQKFLDDNYIHNNSIDFFEKILLLTKENDSLFFEILK